MSADLTDETIAGWRSREDWNLGKIGYRCLGHARKIITLCDEVTRLRAELDVLRQERDTVIDRNFYLEHGVQPGDDEAIGALVKQHGICKMLATSLNAVPTPESTPTERAE